LCRAASGQDDLIHQFQFQRSLAVIFNASAAWMLRRVFQRIAAQPSGLMTDSKRSPKSKHDQRRQFERAA